MKKRKKTLAAQNGTALLMAILVLASTMTVVFGIAVIAIKEIKLNQNINNKVISEYASNSWLEKALYIVKYQQSQGLSLSETKNYLNNMNVPEFTNNTIIAEAAATKGADVFDFSLQENEVAQIDLFEPNEIKASDVKTLQINNWQDLSCAGDPEQLGFSWLNITIISINPEEIALSGEQGNVTKELISCSPEVENPETCSGFKLELNPEKTYIINIMPEYCDTSFHIALFDANGEPTQNDSTLVLNTASVKGESSQKIKTALSWRTTPSALFQNVLFSKERIEK